MPERTSDTGFSKHFDGQRFYNPNAGQARGLRDVLRWKLSSRSEPSPPFIADVEPSVPPRCVDGNAMGLTLVNHSTVLLQQAGCNILTDPIWSERASPFAWIGPQRHRSPGVRWEDLPPIDVALISHNHYDHMDLPTLRRLAARGNTTFIVPPRAAQLLRAENIGPIHELDWGDTFSFGKMTIHCVPALHFSARGMFDRNMSLWCGYAIESEAAMTYFAGDTAFGEHFAEIRNKLGAPRLALLPIGAYEPRWFMSVVHMAPEQAVRAHEILGAKTSVAIHHGTFQLSDEAIDTPKKTLAACGPPESFRVPQNGEFLNVP